MLVVIGVIGLAIDIALRVLRDRVGRWVVRPARWNSRGVSKDYAAAACPARSTTST